MKNFNTKKLCILVLAVCLAISGCAKNDEESETKNLGESTNIPPAIEALAHSTVGEMETTGNVKANIPGFGTQSVDTTMNISYDNNADKIEMKGQGQLFISADLEVLVEGENMTVSVFGNQVMSSSEHTNTVKGIFTLIKDINNPHTKELRDIELDGKKGLEANYDVNNLNQNVIPGLDLTQFTVTYLLVDDNTLDSIKVTINSNKDFSMEANIKVLSAQ